MSVKIRLTRIGRHKDAIYRVVVSDSRSARDGRIIEQIGYFDPAKPVEEADINVELALKWLNKGAQPSESILTLFTKKGIIEQYAKSKKEAK